MPEGNVLSVVREQGMAVRNSVVAARANIRSAIPAAQKLPKIGAMIGGNPGNNPGNSGVLKLDILQSVRTKGLKAALSERVPLLKRGGDAGAGTTGAKDVIVIGGTGTSGSQRGTISSGDSSKSPMATAERGSIV